MPPPPLLAFSRLFQFPWRRPEMKTLAMVLSHGSRRPLPRRPNRGNLRCRRGGDHRRRARSHAPAKHLSGGRRGSSYQRRRLPEGGQRGLRHRPPCRAATASQRLLDDAYSAVWPAAMPAQGNTITSQRKHRKLRSEFAEGCEIGEDVRIRGVEALSLLSPLSHGIAENTPKGRRG